MIREHVIPEEIPPTFEELQSESQAEPQASFVATRDKIARIATALIIGCTLMPETEVVTSTEEIAANTTDETAKKVSIQEVAETLLGNDRFKVATINLGNGQYDLGEDGTPLRKFKEKVREENPDIIALQEAKLNDMAELSKLGYSAVFTSNNNYPLRGGFGNALMVRFDHEIEEHKTFWLEDRGITTKRSATVVAINTKDSDSLRILFTHLSPKLAFAQAERIKEICKEEDIHLLLGYFNMGEYFTNKALGIDPDMSKYIDAVRTYPAEKPRSRKIDRVIMREAAPLIPVARASKAVDVDSDHDMIITTLKPDEK